MTNERLEAAIPQVFDLTPAGIIRALDLRRPVYRQTATHGHFGRELPDFSRERTGRAEKLRRLVETFDLADQRRLSRFMQELNSGGELSEEARRWWINRY